MKRGASRGDAKNVILYWYLQCLVVIDLFTKNKKNKQMSSKWGTFFERPVGTTCSSILVDFGLHLGRVLGTNIGKNRFLRGSKKRLKKKSCETLKKSCGPLKKSCKTYEPGGGESLTSTHPAVPRTPPELPRPSQGRLKPYEHTTTCLEARWRIFY